MVNRIAKLADAMPADFEAALIKTEPNRFYFLDLDAGDAGTVLVLKDKAYFIIDSRYIEIARREVQTAEVILEKNALSQVAELLKKHNVKRLNVENDITLKYFGELKKELPGVELISDASLSQTVAALREIKDEDELARMREAQRITDECFTYICGQIRPGMREIDICLMMETYMRTHGATGLAFPTILVSGPNTSLPHGEPGERELCDGDFITMDYGAKVRGYCTDMTRTVALGHVTPEMEEVYNTVLKAQLAACNAAKAGMDCKAIDEIARKVIRDAGFGDNFGHGLGHSVGIEIHEEPRFSPTAKATAQKSQMMTIEPGVYLPGKFGVRIEDTVVMTEAGCEILGKSNKNLIIL